MSEFLFRLHILWASFCSRTHIFGLPSKGISRRAYFFVYAAHLLRRSSACYCPSNRTEHLLIYRIQSHTNPKRRKGFLKQAGPKSSKEELPERRKGAKRAAECCLKVPTHIWEQDAGSPSLFTCFLFLFFLPSFWGWNIILFHIIRLTVVGPPEDIIGRHIIVIRQFQKMNHRNRLKPTLVAGIHCLANP